MYIAYIECYLRFDGIRIKHLQDDNSIQVKLCFMRVSRIRSTSGTFSSTGCSTMFSGLRSRWMILLLWRYSRPAEMSRVKLRILNSFSPQQFSGWFNTWQQKQKCQKELLKIEIFILYYNRNRFCKNEQNTLDWDI